MANWFIALVLNTEHEDDDGYVFSGFAVIRPADHGINDTEWHHGVRVNCEGRWESRLKQHMEDQNYEVLGLDSWNLMIQSLDDPENVPNNNFIYPRKDDKWDKRPEIY